MAGECICFMQSALKCARREFKLYIFTEVAYIMSYASVCEDVVQRKSIHLYSKVKKTSADFPCSGSWEQWTLCRDNVYRNTVHARSALLMSRLPESSVITKRDMLNMQSRGHKDWN